MLKAVDSNIFSSGFRLKKVIHHSKHNTLRLTCHYVSINSFHKEEAFSHHSRIFLNFLNIAIQYVLIGPCFQFSSE
ncbi:hypothetical protein OUZ56_006417 [Daphnia magna]|uniref:Uncharacterized protein n=1 Tax=Daphnia magna TaxID=35525 RepID=A0ABQ9YVM1_9CRUS|nr:hypothetical protein OUZ56_006417 [Daphnia magna]